MKSFIWKHPSLTAFLWALLIFVLCATPGDYIPSNDWLELLSVDKLVHASIFFCLTLLCFIAIIKSAKPDTYLYVFCLLCILYGASLELMQAYCFRNRSADWQDMVANGLGCVLAFIPLKTLRLYNNTR